MYCEQGLVPRNFVYTADVHFQVRNEKAGGTKKSTEGHYSLGESVPGMSSSTLSPRPLFTLLTFMSV